MVLQWFGALEDAPGGTSRPQNLGFGCETFVDGRATTEKSFAPKFTSRFSWLSIGKKKAQWLLIDFRYLMKTLFFPTFDGPVKMTTPSPP